MRIAIHAGTLRGSGSASVGRGTLRAMAAAPREHELVAWVPRGWGMSPDQLGPLLELRHLGPGLRQKLAFESAALPRELRQLRANRLFSMGDTSTPRPKVPHLLLVQQAYLAYSPADWGFKPPRRFAARMTLMAAYFHAGLGGVTQFTVQTEDMKRNLAERWRIEPSRIIVVPSGLDLDEFDLSEPIQRAARPTLLLVANAGPHKNHAVLPEMMAALAASGHDARCQLTLSRGELPDVETRARSLGVLDHFEWLGSQPRSEVVRLLRTATVAVIPSKLESFGLVYYEAMAAGCPVVAADRDFAREACGPAARYAHPDRGDEFAARVSELIDSKTERANAERQGFDQVHRAALSWSAIATRYLELLEGL